MKILRNWNVLAYDIIYSLILLEEIDDFNLGSMQYVAIALFQIRGPTDLGNFEKYPKDRSIPPDESSGWDKDF